MTRNKAHRGRTRNPIESAAELSEAFHGRPAESVTVYDEESHEHGVLTDLGALLSLTLDDGTRIEFDGETRLASNEAGTQLYIARGDQSIDLRRFGVDESKESVVLGAIAEIEYETDKQHLGEDDKTPGPYVHEFGEEGGDLPTLCYDTVNEKLSLIGGTYRIKRDMRKGWNWYSAGIRD